MALVIVFNNISGLADVSDYEVQVLVNTRRIYEGRLNGHVRADGWKVLVKKFVEDLEEQDGFSPD